MKKLTKVLALAIVVAMACVVLASCGLSGKYEATVFGTGTELEFKGSKVYMTFKVLTFSSDPVEGTYKISGDKITFDFTSDDYSNDVNDMLEKFQGELDFEKGDGYIKIGGTKYNAVKD